MKSLLGEVFWLIKCGKMCACDWELVIESWKTHVCHGPIKSGGNTSCHINCILRSDVRGCGMDFTYLYILFSYLKKFLEEIDYCGTVNRTL